MTTIHLVQLLNTTSNARCVALVDEPNLRCLVTVTSVYELAQLCLRDGVMLTDQCRELASGQTLSYDEIYDGKSEWRLLPPIDVPGEPSRVLVAGTGLTHLGSARQRQAMHLAGQSAQDPAPAVLTDSMRMFQWGLEGGRPTEGQAGIAPEWFYKGDASVLRAPFHLLEIPSHAEDGGEEAEIAGVYVIAADGTPYRLGMCQGNEFSDHKFEKRNYLNLAGSKLRACSLGPELVVDAPFTAVTGEVRIERGGSILWQTAIASGEENMAHSLANLEHHHFKFEGHRQPGGVHVHFFGADALSFGSGIALRTGDITEVHFRGFGRALRNSIHEETKSTKPVRVRTL
ncbi:MAG: GguC family protein [Acidobacteriaceae bacterium]